MEAAKKPTPIAIITKSSMVITSAGVLQTLENFHSALCCERRAGRL
jgi:hypothetical protein